MPNLLLSFGLQQVPHRLLPLLLELHRRPWLLDLHAHLRRHDRHLDVAMHRFPIQLEQLRDLPLRIPR